jgi:hypothetical protein
MELWNYGRVGCGIMELRKDRVGYNGLRNIERTAMVEPSLNLVTYERRVAAQHRYGLA